MQSIINYINVVAAKPGYPLYLFNLAIYNMQLAISNWQKKHPNGFCLLLIANCQFKKDAAPILAAITSPLVISYRKLA